MVSAEPLQHVARVVHSAVPAAGAVAGMPRSPARERWRTIAAVLAAATAAAITIAVIVVARDETTHRTCRRANSQRASGRLPSGRLQLLGQRSTAGVEQLLEALTGPGSNAACQASRAFAVTAPVTVPMGRGLRSNSADAREWRAPTEARFWLG